MWLDKPVFRDHHPWPSGRDQQELAWSLAVCSGPEAVSPGPHWLLRVAAATFRALRCHAFP